MSANEDDMYAHKLGPVYMEVRDPQVGEVTFDGSPTRKRDQIKTRDYMDSREGYSTCGLPPLPGVHTSM